jgi:hypothetical protein
VEGGERRMERRGGGGWVEWFREKKDGEEREGGRISIRTAILSHKGMEGIHFLLPSERWGRGSEKWFSEWWLDPLCSFLGVSCSKGPHGRAALAIRYASPRAARDFGKLPPENSDQTPRKQQPVCRGVVKKSNLFYIYF